MESSSFNTPEYYREQSDQLDNLLKKQELKITDLTKVKGVYQESIKQAKKVNLLALSLPTLVALDTLSDKIITLNAKIKTFKDAENPNFFVWLFRKLFPPAKFKPVENLNSQKLLELHQQISKKALINYLESQKDLADSWHDERDFEFEPKTEEDLQQAIREIYSEAPYRKITDIFYVTSNSKDPAKLTKVSLCTWGQNENNPSIQTFVLQNDGTFKRGEGGEESISSDQLIAKIDAQKQKVVPIGAFLKFYEKCLSFAKDDPKWSRSVFETRDEALKYFEQFKDPKTCENCAALYITQNGLTAIGYKKGKPKDIIEFTFDPKKSTLTHTVNLGLFRTESYQAVNPSVASAMNSLVYFKEWTPISLQFDKEHKIKANAPTRARAQAVIQEEETRGRAQAILPEEAVRERTDATVYVETGLKRERTHAILPEELSPFVRVKKGWIEYSPRSIWPRDPVNKLLARGIESLQLFKDKVDSLSATDATAILDYIFEDTKNIRNFILTKFFGKTYSDKEASKRAGEIQADATAFQKSNDSREKCKILINYMKGYLDAKSVPDKKVERANAMKKHITTAVDSAPSLFPKGFEVPDGQKLIDALTALLAKTAPKS